MLAKASDNLDKLSKSIILNLFAKLQNVRDTVYHYHGLYFDLQPNTFILFPCRYSQCFHKLVFLSSEPTDMRNTIYLEIKLSFCVLFDGANSTICPKVFM